MSKVHVDSFESGWGKIYTAATDKGLAIISLPGTTRKSFDAQVKKTFPQSETAPSSATNRDAARQVKAFLAGKRESFDLKLDIVGTDFQRQVLKKVAAIRYGRTKTYGEIADSIGNPKASRAVGSANGSNPLPLIIPCHRVVATNSLGGYGGGLPMKRRLLNLEGAPGLKRAMAKR